MSLIAETVATLARQAERHAACLVAFSGGKDSVVTLDLCSRAFKRVVCFHLFAVPGLEIVERQLRWARERYGCEVVQLPSESFLMSLANGVYCNSHFTFEAFAGMTPGTTNEWVRAETGIRLIATGMKKADSMARRRFFKTARGPGWQDVVHPLMEWKKFDILAYQAARQLSFPPQHKGHTGGQGMAARSLFYLADEHPEDFKRLTRWFPFAEALLYRRRWHGA